MPTRVILADDHAVVRAGFRRLLEAAGGIEVVAEAENGEQALAAFESHRPDVVVMDIAMPGMDGLEAMRRLLAKEPNARILILSYHEEPVFAERALEEGAYGYVSKSAAPELLYKAIDQVAHGRRYVDPEIAQELAVRRTTGEGDPLSALSEREFAVFLHLAEGKSVADIAAQLHISQNTVNTHYHRIKRKLDLSSRTELTRLAIRHRLIEP